MAALVSAKLLRFFSFLVVSSLLIFLLLEILPGDAALSALGVEASEDTLAAARSRMGLDLPWYERYWSWAAGMLTADLGLSQTYDAPVAGILFERLAVTAPLALLAMLLAIGLALPLGVWAAAREGRLTGSVLSGILQLGMCVPNFWLGIILALVFAVWLGVLPGGGFAGWEAGIPAALNSLWLPAVALALPQASILARVVQTALLEIMAEDYMRTAKSKGAGNARILWLHAMPNALLPTLAVAGLQLSFLVAGAVVVENVFYLPGLGRLIFQSLAQRDLAMLKSALMLMIAATAAVNFAVDIVSASIDPRLRGGASDE